MENLLSVSPFSPLSPPPNPTQPKQKDEKKKEKKEGRKEKGTYNNLKKAHDETMRYCYTILPLLVGVS